MTRYRSILAIAALILTGIVTDVYAQHLTSRSALIMDSKDGRVIYAKNPDFKQPPASTTKLVTAMVALDMLDPEDVIEISRNAVDVYKFGKRLKAGEKYTVRSLLYLALMNSINGAAYSLAEGAGGSEAEFVELMNKKVKAIGANDTRYVNSSGLPGPGQYITAADLALIMNEALKYPLIRTIIHTKTKDVASLDGRVTQAVNTDKLLWGNNCILGGKTGFTNKAMHCLAFAANKNGNMLVGAVLGDYKRSALWNSALKLVSITGGESNEYASMDSSASSKSFKKRHRRHKKEVIETAENTEDKPTKIKKHHSGRTKVSHTASSKKYKGTKKKLSARKTTSREIAYNKD